MPHGAEFDLGSKELARVRSPCEGDPMARAFQLLLFDVRAVLHRLRHDLGKEITVLLASLILLATFGYIFNDFLNIQIAALSAAMRDTVALVVAGVFCLAAAAATAKTLRRAASDNASTRAMAKILGEAPEILTRYTILHAITIVLLIHGAAWLIIFRFLVNASLFSFGLVELVMLVITWIGAQISPRTLGSTRAGPTILRQRAPLVAWRLTLHLQRNRGHQLLYGLSLAFVVLGSLAFRGGAPLLAPVATALAAGVLLAAILAFSLARDLEHAWIEHALGVSHDEMVTAYELFAIALVIPAALVAAVCTAWAAPDAESLATAWKPAAILAVTPLFAPYMLFQIDARRPGINMIGLTIIGLFLGTAIFAHGLAVLLPLIAKAGIASNQANRFHRA